MTLQSGDAPVYILTCVACPMSNNWKKSLKFSTFRLCVSPAISFRHAFALRWRYSSWSKPSWLHRCEGWSTTCTRPCSGCIQHQEYDPGAQDYGLLQVGLILGNLSRRGWWLVVMCVSPLRKGNSTAVLVIASRWASSWSLVWSLHQSGIFSYGVFHEYWNPVSTFYVVQLTFRSSFCGIQVSFTFSFTVIHRIACLVLEAWLFCFARLVGHG